ncbi:hypothetical protein OBBRIDRAFT_798886 [Obba rivulosa]|uniref:Uncharacterized protein n=1 Tax=Obba rivulosa TaxID=1052685 RepID=A0A8E2DJE0_9APHY|nr:hypothetical protein OBBRIDRAFT_798886 [Obba rivulosa]
MFPKGPRFPAAKVPDVPGPAAYNPQDPDYETYKRGAFLEKTNRFFKGRLADTPGPGAYELDSKNPTKTANDRYAALQHKVEELERLHAESKKSHSQEVERLKLDLKQAQRQAAEQSERADKLKKLNDMVETKSQDMKRSSSIDKAQIRELGVKLRAAEQERGQSNSVSRQEAVEARKALQAAETRHKDELRKRDVSILELMNALREEGTKHGSAAAKVRELTAAFIREGKEKLALKESLHEVRAASENVTRELKEVKIQATEKEKELVEERREALACVAREYGRLASSTISKSPHHKLKRKNGVLQVRIFHLERKLANAEAQVQELAHLVRCTKDENIFLAKQLKEVEAEIGFYRQAWKDCVHERQQPLSTGDIEQELATLEKESILATEETMKTLALDSRLWDKYHRLKSESLLLHGSVLLKGLLDAQELVERGAIQLSESEQRHAEHLASLDALRVRHDRVLGELEAANTSLAVSKTTEQALANQVEETRAQTQAVAKQLDEMRAQTKAEVAIAEQSLQREKEAAQRLAATLQKSRIAEEALRDEIQKLIEDLEEADRYRDAYNSLVEEVDALVARNALAEDEAQRLSKFNAEILGHNNPAQRIVYVDKIRRELHETKQKLLMSVRDRDAVQMENDGLRHELELYKSVAVSHEMKPRTALTRVSRMPPASQNLSLKPELQVPSASRSGSLSPRRTRFGVITEIDHSHDDMTIDEIM